MSSIIIDRDFAADLLPVTKFTQSQCWLDILLRANTEAGEYNRGGRMIKVPVGSLVLITKTTAKRWGVEEKDVDKTLEILSVVGMIKLRKLKGCSVVSVIDFSAYLVEDK